MICLEEEMIDYIWMYTAALDGYYIINSKVAYRLDASYLTKEAIKGN